MEPESSRRTRRASTDHPQPGADGLHVLQLTENQKRRYMDQIEPLQPLYRDCRTDAAKARIVDFANAALLALGPKNVRLAINAHGQLYVEKVSRRATVPDYTGQAGRTTHRTRRAIRRGARNTLNDNRTGQILDENAPPPSPQDSAPHYSPVDDNTPPFAPFDDNAPPHAPTNNAPPPAPADDNTSHFALGDDNAAPHAPTNNAPPPALTYDNTPPFSPSNNALPHAPANNAPPFAPTYNNAPHAPTNNAPPPSSTDNNAHNIVVVQELSQLIREKEQLNEKLRILRTEILMDSHDPKIMDMLVSNLAYESLLMEITSHPSGIQENYLIEEVVRKLIERHQLEKEIVDTLSIKTLISDMIHSCVFLRKGSEMVYFSFDNSPKAEILKEISKCRSEIHNLETKVA